MKELEQILNNSAGIAKLQLRNVTVIGKLRRALYPVKMWILDRHRAKIAKRINRHKLEMMRKRCQELDKNKYL
jgi:hypothetical protein